MDRTENVSSHRITKDQHLPNRGGKVMQILASKSKYWHQNIKVRLTSSTFD